MAKTRTKAAATPRRGRPPSGKPPVGVTGIRLPPDVLEGVDAIVEATNAAPDRGPLGPASRSSIIVHILREYIRVHGVTAPATAQPTETPT